MPVFPDFNPDPDDLEIDCDDLEERLAENLGFTEDGDIIATPEVDDDDIWMGD